MASRTWVAVGLCCLVWFTYMRWFAPPPVPQIHSEAVPIESSATQPSGAASSATNAPVLGNVPFGTPLEVNNSYKDQSPKLDVSFSDAGGKISGIDLRDYTETLKADSPPIHLVSPDSSTYALATLFSEPSLQSFTSGTYERGPPQPGQVQYKRAYNGVEVTKNYKFLDSHYLMEANFKFHFDKADKKDWGFLMIPIGASSLKYDAAHPLNSWEVVTYQGDSVKRRSTEKIELEQEILQGNTSWLAFGNRYFSTALINGSEINPDIVLTKNRGFVGAYLRYPLVLKSDQKDVNFAVKIYTGPKDYAELAKIPGLKQLIDYGTFSFLAYPLLELLRFFNKFVHNYGLAIILLTILVRLLFYPLSLKSYRSMKAMQKLQPQIAALKEKYKDDTQKFGQEQMALFKTHKVNPAGGCLPMLVQLPVFIALYAVLGNSIELFHAPFFGWIQDLSAKDPFYIFPILMGISMFVQQKMTPNPGMDPAQQKVMMLMPVVFTFVMLNLPSGLTIYIFLSTVMGIVQQLSMNREPKVKSGALVSATERSPK